MQRLAPKAAQRLGQRLRAAAGKLQASGVDGIAQQRESAMGQMHSNLMGAPGLQFDIEGGVMGKALTQAKVSERRFAAVTEHGHARALPGVTSNRRIHRPAAGGHTAHNGEIFSRQRFALELRNQSGVRAQARRNHQQARGVFVETMNDARAGDALQRGSMPEQRVDERAVGVTGPGMHHESGGFIEHQQIRVLKEHAQRKILRPPGDFGL